MGQERDCGEPMMVSRSRAFVLAALGLLLSSVVAVAADDTGSCTSFAGQNPDPSTLLQTIDAAPGEGTRRLAIVVGNDYHGAPKADGTFERSKFEVKELTNASKDARAIARLLLTLQFKVACFLNVTAKSLDRILTAGTRVGDEVTNGVTLFYFAGHGYADGAESFLVGDGAEDDSMESLRLGSYPQSKVLSALRSRRAPVIAIFDMCRAPVSLVDKDGNRDIGQPPLAGYLSVSKEPGILAQYSTSPNEYAADLPSQSNGLYVRVFIDLVPGQPGISAAQLLIEKIGPALANGQTIDGKVYKQTPNVVAYPYEWSRVQIFDASLGTDLDSAMAAVGALENMVESGPYAIGLACQNSIQIRDNWKAAAEPTGSRVTIAQLLDRIERLQQKIRAKGSPCSEILRAAAETSAIVMPPLVHVTKAPTILSSTGDSENSFQKAKIGTWIATNAVQMSFSKTKSTNVAVAYEPTELDNAFVPSSKVPKGIATSDVYFTAINNKNAKLIDTKDQIVISFKEGTVDVIDPEKIGTTVKNLKNASTKYAFLILPQLKPLEPNYLARVRLASVRIVAVLKQLAKAGIRYDQIVQPNLDQDSPISISTIQPDNILVKFSGGIAPPFDTLSVEALKPSGAATGAKQNLEIYEALTKKEVKG